MKSLFPPLACLFQIKNGTFLMQLWLLGRSLGSRLGLRLATLLLRPPRPPRPTAGRRRRRRRIRGGGTRNLLSLPGDDKDNDGWGDHEDEGATAEPILRVLHD
jgi:hypothetical protein